MLETWERITPKHSTLCWSDSFKKTLEKQLQKQLPTSNLVKTAEFVLRNNYFEFSEKSVSANIRLFIDILFVPSYACTYMDDAEIEFLQTQRFVKNSMAEIC